MNKKQKKKIVNLFKVNRSFLKKLDDTDIFYIGLMEEIADLYLKFQKKFISQTIVADANKAIEIAWLLMGYFEDVVNQIGIFKAFKKKNIQIYGVPLPLFIREPQPILFELIDERAIRYLLWFFFMETDPRLILSPDHKDLKIIALKIFKLFQNKQKSAPKTNRIKKFLDISGEPGEVVKDRLMWFGLNSYLFFLPASHIIRDLYDDMQIDHFLLESGTFLSGYSPLEIFIEVVDFTEEEIHLLKQWEQPLMAIYKIIENQGDKWIVHNLINHEKYHVIKEEKDKKSERVPFNKNGICVGALVPWNGTWRWTGLTLVYPPMDQKLVNGLLEKFKQNYPQYVFRCLKKKVQDAMRCVNNERDKFISYYKNDYIVLKNGSELETSINQFYRETYKSRHKKLSKNQKEKLGIKSNTPHMKFPEDLKKADDVAAFYFKDRGIGFYKDFSRFFYSLKKEGEHLTSEDCDIIRSYIADPTIPPDILYRFKDEFSFDSVSKAFLIKDWHEKTDLSFLLRCYKGREFKQKFPNILFMDI